jgi:hypothetical protein
MLMNDNETSFGNRVIPLLDVFYDEHPKKKNDAGIADIREPWGNSCSTAITPLVMLANYGSDPLQSVEIKYRVDQGSYSTFNWNGTLNSGDAVEVSLPGISAGTGFHAFTCFTTLPNGSPEGFTYNDTAKSMFNINALPTMLSVISESFEGDVFPPPGWVENYSDRFQWSRTSLGNFSGNRS